MTPEAATALLERWPDLADTSLPCRQKMARDIANTLREALLAGENKYARFYPWCGAIEGFFKQGVFPCGPWWWRFKQRAGRWLNRHTMEFLGDRPGVTDFWIVQWLILRDPEIALRLYRRQLHPSPDVAISCSWALESLAGRFPDLAQQLRDAVETHAKELFANRGQQVFQ